MRRDSEAKRVEAAQKKALEDQEIDAARRRFSDRMKEIAAKDPKAIGNIADQAFPGKTDDDRRRSLSADALAGRLPQAPNVRFVEGSVLGGKAGAYSADRGGTIFLSRELMNDRQRLDAAYTEETGHHWDRVLDTEKRRSAADSPGDPGRIFQLGVEKGGPIDQGTVGALRKEDDRGQIIVDGRTHDVHFRDDAKEKKDKVETTDVKVTKGDVYPTKRHDFDGDPFDVSVTPKTSGKARYLEITLSYQGKDDADRQKRTFLRPVYGNGEINAKVQHEKTTFGETFPGGAKGIDKVLIDVFGDGKQKIEIGHATLLNQKWDPPARSHSFWLTTQQGKERPITESQSFFIKSKDAVPAKEKPIVKADGPKKDPSATALNNPTNPTKPSVGSVVRSDSGSLPAATALDLAKARLNDALSVDGIRRKDGVPWSILERQLDADKKKFAEAKPGSPLVKGETAAAAKAQRLADASLSAERTFKALSLLDKKENYLPDIAGGAQKMVREVRDRAETALFAAYGDDPKTYEALRAEADKAMAALPHRLNQLYLKKGAGIEKLVDDSRNLNQDIMDLRAAAKRGVVQIRPIDQFLGIGNDPKQQISTRMSSVLDGLRKDQQDGKPVEARVYGLTTESQRIVGAGSALAMHEQFNLFTRELDHVADKLPFVDSQKKVAEQYAKTFDGYVKRIEDAQTSMQKEADRYGAAMRAAKTDEEKKKASDAFEKSMKEGDEKWAKALQDFHTTIGGDQFKKDLKAIEGRLETIQTVNRVAKVTAIVAGSALLGGGAGALVGGALEGLGAGAFLAGTGAFAAEVTTFTLASRYGNEKFIGPNQTSFGEDLATNAAMFGLLKGVNAGYGKIFKSAAESHKVAYYAGQAATGLITLHGFSEMHHLVKEGRLMDGEERYRTVFQNTAMFAGLQVGGFVTRPLQDRIETAVGKTLSPMFKRQLEAIDGQLAGERAALKTQLDKLQKDPSDKAVQADLPKTLDRMEQLWNKEVEALKRAADRRAISQDELKKAIGVHNERLSSLEHQLAQAGADIGVGAQTYRPLQPGVIAFKDAQIDALKKHYTDQKGSFKEVGDGLYVGQAGNDRYYYVPESKAPQPVERLISDAAEASRTGNKGALDQIQAKLDRAFEDLGGRPKGTGIEKPELDHLRKLFKAAKEGKPQDYVLSGGSHGNDPWSNFAQQYEMIANGWKVAEQGGKPRLVPGDKTPMIDFTQPIPGFNPTSKAAPVVLDFTHQGKAHPALKALEGKLPQGTAMVIAHGDLENGVYWLDVPKGEVRIPSTANYDVRVPLPGDSAKWPEWVQRVDGYPDDVVRIAVKSKELSDFLQGGALGKKLADTYRLNTPIGDRSVLLISCNSGRESAASVIPGFGTPQIMAQRLSDALGKDVAAPTGTLLLTQGGDLKALPKGYVFGPNKRMDVFKPGVDPAVGAKAREIEAAGAEVARIEALPGSGVRRGAQGDALKLIDQATMKAKGTGVDAPSDGAVLDALKGMLPNDAAREGLAQFRTQQGDTRTLQILKEQLGRGTDLGGLLAERGTPASTKSKVQADLLSARSKLANLRLQEMGTLTDPGVIEALDAAKERQKEIAAEPDAKRQAELRDRLASDLTGALGEALTRQMLGADYPPSAGYRVLSGLEIAREVPGVNSIREWVAREKTAGRPSNPIKLFEANGKLYESVTELDGLVAKEVGGKLAPVRVAQTKVGMHDLPKDAASQNAKALAALRELAGGTGGLRVFQHTGKKTLGSDLTGDLDLGGVGGIQGQTFGPAGKGYDTTFPMSAEVLRAVAELLLRGGK